jgi:hypothetical protein
VVVPGTTIANLGKAIGAEIKLDLQMHPFLVLTMAIMLLQVAMVVEEAVEAVEEAVAATDLSFSNSPPSPLFCFECNVEVPVPYFCAAALEPPWDVFQLPLH